MRRFLSTDIAARIISVVLAVVVWVYIVILLDPAIDVTFHDIPVIYMNTMNLSSDNYVLMSDKALTVSLQIRGSRTRLARLNKADIRAYIDLNGYSQKGEFSLPISVQQPYEGVSVIDQNPRYMNVQIDRVVEKEFPISVETDGIAATDYVVYESLLSQNTVTLKGPEDLINSIDRVVAAVNVEGASDDVRSAAGLTFFNSNNDVIASRFLTAQPERVEVSSEILKRKQVDVKAVLSNSETHRATVLTHSKIVVLGRAAVVDATVEVYTKPIAVEHITEDTKLTAPLNLPADLITLEKVTDVNIEVTPQKNGE